MKIIKGNFVFSKDLKNLEYLENYYLVLKKDRIKE
jgi:hypothetical protein